jgi:hypothetical protein
VTVLGGLTAPQPAMVRDAASQGFGLEMANPVPQGSLLKINFGEFVLLGEAKHCRVTGDAFFVGVELEVMCSVAEFSRFAKVFEDQGDPWLTSLPV